MRELLNALRKLMDKFQKPVYIDSLHRHIYIYVYTHIYMYILFLLMPYQASS